MIMKHWSYGRVIVISITMKNSSSIVDDNKNDTNDDKESDSNK